MLNVLNEESSNSVLKHFLKHFAPGECVEWNEVARTEAFNPRQSVFIPSALLFHSIFNALMSIQNQSFSLVRKMPISCEKNILK